MKKLLRPMLVGLSLLLSISSAIAQVYSSAPDSTAESRLISSLVSVDTTKAKTTQNQLASTERITKIAVKAGDSITISAVVLDNTTQKNRFWKSMAKVVVPSFVLGTIDIGGKSPSAERPSVTSLAPFNAGLAIVPGAINALTERESDAKVFIGLSAYDADGQHLATVKDFMTKAAQKDWQELRVVYRAEKDGFIEIAANRGGSDGFVFETYGNNNWLKVSQNTNQSASAPVSRDSRPTNGGQPEVVTNGGTGGGFCIRTYWCVDNSCTLISTVCQDFPDYGNPPDYGNGDNPGDNSPGSNPKPDSDALGQCSENLNIALDRCYRNFALTLAGAAAFSEAPPAGIAIIIEAIIQNGYCIDDAYQDFDNCAKAAGF